jgi:hypothetical protein
MELGFNKSIIKEDIIFLHYTTWNFGMCKIEFNPEWKILEEKNRNCLCRP